MNATGSGIYSPVDSAPLRRLTVGLTAAGLTLALLWRLRFVPLAGRLLPLALAALLLAIAGLAGAQIMSWARRRATLTPQKRRFAIRRGDPALIGRAARWPQAVVVTLFSVGAIICAWAPPTAAPVPQNLDFGLGAATLVLTFPLLIIERLLAATRPTRLPEAASLRALFLVAVLTWTAAGLVRIAAGLGVPLTDRLDLVLAVPLTAVAVELSLRAVGRCFLPPPQPAEARAASASLLARMIAEGVQARSLAAPIRQNLGIDFSRSWALGFLRQAALPAGLLLVVLCWGLTGVAMIGMDQRAVYERFGAPAAILHPGLHFILPYPMGQVRRVEFGPLHEIALTDAGGAEAARVGAEDLPPPEADRLWEQTHPAELLFLIASEGTGQQNFQVVSADIKLRYRIGLTDRDALAATYRVTSPTQLLRSTAGRVIDGFFARRTLDGVLGENREAMADNLRAQLQHELDDMQTGIDLAAVVIEAIHPPAGAAQAYHAVQAAQIQAITSIAAEQGRALAERSNASQYATALTTQATAAGAEMVGAANADLSRFKANHAAADEDNAAFQLESRLAAVAMGLAKSSLTIIDHRLAGDDVPMLDFRPPGTASVPTSHQGSE